MTTPSLLPLVIALALFSSLHPTFSASSSSSPEISSLLLFKSRVNDPTLALSGWDPSTPFAPCDWRGVSCGGSGRVTDLRLPSIGLSGTLPDQAFSNLTDLERLSLRSNSLSGPLPSSLSLLADLRTLFLQSNAFSGAIPPGLFSNLTYLRVLNLSRNRLLGQLDVESLPSPSANLAYLDLSTNLFSGGIPRALANLSQLTLINLSHNLLDGQIPATFGALQKLQYLWLDNNSLEGTLPSAITNCSSLVHLSVEDNRLSGIVPAAIGLLPKLQVVALSRNNFSGEVTSSLVCSPSIRNVRLGSNMVTDLIGPGAGNACGGVLEELGLDSNSLKGGFPTWLTNASRLRSMDFSNNFLSGTLPDEIGRLNLLELRLANNSLGGEIPSAFRSCTSLAYLDLEGNGFTGEIPWFVGEFRGLKVLLLRRNSFSGPVPQNISSLTALEVLDLGVNALDGSFPVEVTRLQNLTTLDLSGNRFIGSEMPASIGNLSRMMVLNLSSCGFSGSIPTSIANLLRLTSLDLSRQNLSGEVPIEIAGLPNIQVVALQGNMLSGNIPEGFSSLRGLTYLNLSANMLNGQIPATFGFLQSLSVLSLSENHISGPIPAQIGNCSSLQALELQSNYLSGPVPADLSRLSWLNILDLSRNNLTRGIPVSLSGLSNLVSLDLSSNDLSGDIPAKLSQIPGLVSFNVSGNNLNGEIPPALGSRFNSTSFADNLGLCGKPLGNECKNAENRKRKRLIFLIAIIASGGILLALFCCFYIYRLLLWRRKLKEKASGEKKSSPGRSSSRGSGGRGSTDNGAPKLVMFNNKITLAETIEATRQFDEENVLSRTRFGLVFKACYNDGMVLSIRRLPDGALDESIFRKAAEALGKVKHRNLTVLRGFYAGPPDMRLLVYDYMPNGNLATLLQEASHQDGHVLNWPMRHLIALGIARGLGFLHGSSIVHADVKPQNVLFDADFEAHLSDFGLRPLVALTPTEGSSSLPVGTLGYVSPEAVLAGEVTRESDVYSFGIVLLELLTGKRPVVFTQDEDIVKWVKKQLQRGQINELLEPGLLELDPESSEWEEFLLGVKVGLLCTAPDAMARPTMQDVVFMLEGCRAGPNIPSSADPTTHHSPA
ncbi:hypothetical protein MLD38_007800 [Melastoma candidum]|uniref:Uncharacterized protein n=1 Tax=Melastoma candidum TaxID=119954 RepID=A0ACB9RST3_9MYRT|nr:hypothetical protein MLD38_007800 [Melastoma candidum]